MDTDVTRRTFLAAAGLAPALALVGCAADSPGGASPQEQAGDGPTLPPAVAAYGVAAAALAFTTYKDPSCGCCGGWVDYAQSHGARVTVEHPDSLDAVFAEHDIAPELQACHLTTNPDGVVLVGHLGMRQVLEYLAAPPAGSRGLTVPAMPVGTPGMESGAEFEPHDVLLLADGGGPSVFASVASAADLAP